MVLCGGIDNAKKLFSKDKLYPAKLLLIDSDGPVPSNVKGYHSMVQAMESWFLADWEKLAEYFDYQGDSPAENKNIEAIENTRVMEILNNLAKPRGKGRDNYHKIDDATRLLQRVRLVRVRKLHHCDRFCVAVEAAIAGAST